MTKIQKKLINQLCGSILDKADTIIAAKDGREHEAYLSLWKMLHKEDAKVSLMFDNMRRSDAFYKLAAWKNNNLISEDDMKEFSDETQQVIQLLTQM